MDGCPRFSEVLGFWPRKVLILVPELRPEYFCQKTLGAVVTLGIVLLLKQGLTIANFRSLPSMSFEQALGKLQGKVVTHSEEVGWWRTLMVECVTLFWLFSAYGTTD